MMENRSFDHYFGWLPDADGRSSRASPTRRATRSRRATSRRSARGGTQYKGCGHPDPGHGWDQGRAQLQGGFLADGSGNDEFALTYFNQGDLGFIHEAARTYTLYDRYFCSLLGLDLAEPLLQVVGAVGRPQEQHAAAHGRQQVGDDLRPRDRPRR